MYIEDKKILQARMVLNREKEMLRSRLGNDTADNMRKIIDVICEHFNNNAYDIFKVGMNQRDRRVKAHQEVVIRKLEMEGILCSHESFKPIGDFIRQLKKATGWRDDGNETITPEQLLGSFCYENIASLNTYDYKRLLKETEILKEWTGIENLAELSPTLARILEEKRTNGVPGRLPYDHPYTSETMRRYRRLRVLDEILAEAEEPLSNDEIIRQLSSRLLECGVDRIGRERKDAGDYDAMLKNDFRLLADLISIETRHGLTRAYDRTGVFDLSVRGCRKYREDVRAFELVLTDKEAHDMDTELRHRSLRTYHDVVMNTPWKFPMLNALLIYGDSYNGSDKSRLEDLNASKRTDSPMFISDYYAPDDAEFLLKIKEIIRRQQPVELVPEGDTPRRYYPISIKRDGSQWVVIAQESWTHELHALTPEYLKKVLETERRNEYFVREFHPEYLIGLHAPDAGYEEPLDVTLSLTTNGYQNLRNCGAYHILDQDRLFPDEQPVRRWKTGKKEISQLNITVYLNEDFYQDLKWQADHGNLIDIRPLAALRWFTDRYRALEGHDWRHDRQMTE